jgi:hypothetical protein
VQSKFQCVTAGVLSKICAKFRAKYSKGKCPQPVLAVQPTESEIALFYFNEKATSVYLPQFSRLAPSNKCGRSFFRNCNVKIGPHSVKKQIAPVEKVLIRLSVPEITRWGSSVRRCGFNGPGPVRNDLVMTGTRIMTRPPCTAVEGQLVVFDLIASNTEWNSQMIRDHIVERLTANNVALSSFPSTISIQNLAKQRSLFNNIPYRKKMRLASARYHEQIGCERSINLFEFLYPAPIPPPPLEIQEVDHRRKDKRKIDTLQKRLRRWKAKHELMKRQYSQLSKETEKITEKAEMKLRSTERKIKNAQRRSKLKSITNSNQKRTIVAMRKVLNKCIQLASKRQMQAMKTMITKVRGDVNGFFDDFDTSDEEIDDLDSDGRELRLVIIHKQRQVSREAVRQFCKAFDDPDVNASRLESKWKQCRKDVVGKYQLVVTSKVAIDKRGDERVYVFVADFDNYLTQIIALEGLPSNLVDDAGEPELWVRIGGDGRSIHRHSNNVLIVMALMDPANPRRSHSPLFVHTLMLIDGDESHDLFADALSVLDQWIQRLSSDGFQYDDTLFKMKFVLTGDMKFIQLVKGLQGATSVYSCPLCLKPKQSKMSSRGPRPCGGFRCACDSIDGTDPCEHWSGPGEYRNQAQASLLAETGGDCWSHLGHHKQAPLKSIDWKMIVLDSLHALLRITDVIFGSLYEWARRSCDPLDKDGLLKASKSFVLCN